MSEYIEVNRACYDELAEQYGKRVTEKSIFEESVASLCEFVLSQYSCGQKGTVLEIGPGAGETLAYYTQCGFMTIGVELSACMAKVAHNTSPKSILINGNILELDFVEESFEIITMGAVIHLFPKKDASELLNKVRSWLKKDGLLFINTTCSVESKEGFFEKKDYQGSQTRFRKHWQEEELSVFLQDHKFKILNTMYTDEQDRQKKWVAYVCKK